MNAAIELDGITKRFGDVVANDSIDLTVESGTIHTILGENGAGKSTLMNVLYGLYQPDEGGIVVDGEPVEFDSPRDAIDRGIGMIHQHFMLVDPLTVTQNVVLGQEPRGSAGITTDTATASTAVAELSENFGFGIDPNDTIEEISLGEQQRVEILKTMYRGADVFILDEPTAVLTPQEVSGLMDILEELAAEGNTILFITHKLEEAMAVSDRISVLRDGELITTVDATGTTREDLAKAMVGRDVVLETSKTPQKPGEELLSVTNAVVRSGGQTRLDDVSFTVHEGEIFGVAGVDGNGQAVLSEAIGGIRELSEGSIRYEGEEVMNGSRQDRIDAGVSYIPEDRQATGLVMSFDLRDNALLGRQHTLPFGTRNTDADGAAAIIEEYDVVTAGPGVRAANLSGGNQQKFIVGRELRHDPAFVVAVHPTRGLDVGSVEFIHNQLLDYRRKGAGILLISSKLDELKQLSDRLGVMYEGRLVDEVDPDTVTDRDIGLLMAGETATVDA